MKYRSTDTTPVAAAKTGFSTATGYRLGEGPQPPSLRRAPRDRRRPDPLAGIFDAEVVPMPEAAPGLRPVAVPGEVLRRHPELGEGIRRTLTWAFRCQRLIFGYMMVLRLFQDPRSEPECMTRPGSGHDQPHIRSRRRPVGMSARSRIPLAAGWARADETNLEHGSCQTRVRPGSSTRIRRG